MCRHERVRATFGRDLPSEVLGEVSFGDMAFLEITGRIPDAKQSRMFNAMLVTLAEHGLTPSTIAARLTYLGAPEAMQAAVAAGLSGLGSVFVGSIEGTERMLCEAMPTPDPAAVLAALAEETRFAGPYVALVQQVAASAERDKGKSLPVNATGIPGALCCEMGFDWRVCRGIREMSRAVGLVGHILEEIRNPIARQIWQRSEQAATDHFRTPI